MDLHWKMRNKLVLFYLFISVKRKKKAQAVKILPSKLVILLVCPTHPDTQSYFGLEH